MELTLLGLGADLFIPRLLMGLCLCGAFGLLTQRVLGIFIKPRNK